MANIFSVSNSEELMNALASASGGDTIELAGGDYGDLKLVDGKTTFDVNFDAPVTIRSVDAEPSASFSSINLYGVSNLTFENVTFDYEFDVGDSILHKPFQVWGESANITFKDSIFDGDLANGLSEIDDGYGYAIGLTVRDSSDIAVENSEFFNWYKGAAFGQVDNLLVSGNELHSLRSDGFNFVEVKSVVIENNYFHDFNKSPNSPDHLDMIQFWTNGTTSPTTDVVIRNNILDIGEGSVTQSIFMRNEEVDTGRAGEEMYYQNILIENNTIYNAHTHGITVGETDGLTIQNNSVLQAGSEFFGNYESVTIPKINIKPESTAVTVKDNIVSSINGFDDQVTWSVAGNAIVHPSEYLEQFITSEIDTDNGTHQFTVLPGSMVDQLGAGAEPIKFPNVSDSLKPLFNVYSSEADGHSLIFDASLSVGPLGFISEDDADFVWSFEDGSTTTGQVVQHDFGSPGYHGVTLTVVNKNGEAAQTSFTAGIIGDDIVHFDAQSGLFVTSAYGEETPLENGAATLIGTVDGQTLKLGGEGVQASVASSELSSFFGTDAFELSMTIKADSAASWGEIARVHTSFTVSVDQNGNLTLHLSLDDGSGITMVSQGVSLSDGAFHDVGIRFDGDGGFAEILIDGEIVASESVSGALWGGPRDLAFGNPWGKQNFDGELTSFALTADTQDFPIYDGAAEVVSNTSTTTSEPALPEEEPTVPQEDTTVPEEEPTGPQEDADLREPLLLNGYQLNFADITTSDTTQLHDDAHIIDTEDGLALSFDGKKDFVSLGRLTEFEKSEKIAFSVDFTSHDVSGNSERLVWNHQKIGLTLEGDGLRVHVGNNNDHFHKGFQISDLGLNDGAQHSTTVMVDAETDRLQVVVDDVIVLDEQGTDFDFAGAGGYEWGWSLGTGWNNWFEGQVHDFQVSDDFMFVEPVTEDGTILA